MAGQHLIFRDNQKMEPPNSTVPRSWKQQSVLFRQGCGSREEWGLPERLSK